MMPVITTTTLSTLHKITIAAHGLSLIWWWVSLGIQRKHKKISITFDSKTNSTDDIAHNFRRSNVYWTNLVV